MRPSAIAGRWWRAYADILRCARRDGDPARLARPFGVAPDGSAEWFHASSEAWGRYRTLVTPSATEVSVICVTSRPWLLNQLVDQVDRQIDVDVEFILVTNHAGFRGHEIGRATAALDRCVVVEADPRLSLGQCLNLGLAAASSRFVAKFDDDDWYGAHYLVDALRAHSFAGAGVVGKHTYYAHFERWPERRILRFPGREFSSSATLAGGTLVWDRERVGSAGFADLAVGEDRQFVRDCHRRGVASFSADRFNYSQYRWSGNTWSFSDDEFASGGFDVALDDPIHLVDR